MRTPSVKTLREVFGDNAPEAKRILQMTRSELLELPAGAARAAECYHPPKTYDLRMTCLDALVGYGVEGFECKDGTWCTYLNAGDSYAPTVVYFHGTYRVQCWADIAEKHAV